MNRDTRMIIDIPKEKLSDLRIFTVLNGGAIQLEEKPKKEIPTMNISEQLEEIKSDICDKYCKYPEIYGIDDEACQYVLDKMYRERCDKCPLNKLS